EMVGQAVAPSQGSINVFTSTAGSVGTPGVNAVQTLSFTGFAAGDTFTLTLANGRIPNGAVALGDTQVVTTAPIAYDPDPSVLMAHIQAALDALNNVPTSVQATV